MGSPVMGMDGSWSRALREYRTYQHAAGFSAGTIRLHGYRLLDLCKLAPRPAAVTTALLLTVLSHPTWKPETRKSVRSCFRSFFRWAVRSGLLEVDPSEPLPPVRIPRAVPRPTPEHVVRSGLRDADERERLMIRLGAVGGLRCCEIARVHASDWDGLRLRVVGKGGASRLVPVVDPSLRRDLDALDGWAFPNRWTGEPITAGHVSRLLSRALSQTWTGHTLRHRFGTRACEGTRDIAAVAEVMGHARLETTRIYALVGEDRLLAVAGAAAVAS